MMRYLIPQPETINKLRFAANAAFALLAGMQLDVFTPLKEGPRTAEQIAEAIGVAPPRLRLLLYCLVTAGLLTEENGHFANTAESDQFLVKGSPSNMGNMHALLSHRWVTNLPGTAESIRTGVPQAKVDFVRSSPHELEVFLRRINPLTVIAAHALIKKFDCSSAQSLADIGCGGAGLALAVAKACSHLRVTAIDLPLVTPIARKIVDEHKMTDRVEVLSADVLSGPLPGSYDVVILRGLLQVLSSLDARLAVKNVSGAVKPGGSIYLIAQILDDSRIGPPEAVGFNQLFINSFEIGESYTESEHRAWLTEAGFVDIERADFLLPDEHGLMTARKPV